MDWILIGKRIRKQREYLGFTREVFAEKLDVTPKFCSDIELGLKGMSVTTLCKISDILGLTTDYILFGAPSDGEDDSISQMIRKCPPEKRQFLEDIIKSFLRSTHT
ncbi:MAG: helix-turn-helix transcriptional regulator [Clostridia bacterium]|nr:helix-turn-helix transcriptional regulator [Clostridia bacterium]